MPVIVDAAGSRLVASRSWLDAGSVWVCETATGKVESTTLSSANMLSLVSGSKDLFGAVHRFASGLVEVSVHTIASPAVPVARMVETNEGPRLEGDLGAWANLPGAFVGYSAPADGPTRGVPAHALFLIHDSEDRVDKVPLDWYEGSYDPYDQPVVQVTEVPGQELLILSMRSDSNPVLYDPRRRVVVQRITLANRNGSADLRFRSTASELWAADYDTLLRLDPADWSIKDSVRLQDEIDGVRSYIAEFGFNSDESLCAVARPYSGDVVVLDTRTFEPVYEAVTGQYPFEVAILSDGRIFARDLKTGHLLRGSSR